MGTILQYCTLALVIYLVFDRLLRNVVNRIEDKRITKVEEEIKKLKDDKKWE